MLEKNVEAGFFPGAFEVVNCAGAQLVASVLQPLLSKPMKKLFKAVI